MQTRFATNLVLFLNALALFAIAIGPALHSRPVDAQARSAHSLYVEPGVKMLRAPDGSKQVFGKVVVDLQTGNVWGFPTLTNDPYPSNRANSQMETSHPILLGRFALEDMDK
jgi:hypothetical protein